MVSMRQAALWTFFTFLIGSVSAQGGGSSAVGGAAVKPSQTWQAKMKDETLKRAAPASGFIANAKDFASLWKTWRPDENVPPVDFKRNLVLVGLAGGPNLAGIGATLEEGGNLKVIVRQTLIGGPGFGYQLAVVPRAGIRTVNGKAVPAP